MCHRDGAVNHRQDGQEASQKGPSVPLLPPREKDEDEEDGEDSPPFDPYQHAFVDPYATWGGEPREIDDEDDR